jgi:hypothetical protein
MLWTRIKLIRELSMARIIPCLSRRVTLKWFRGALVARIGKKGEDVLHVLVL